MDSFHGGSGRGHRDGPRRFATLHEVYHYTSHLDIAWTLVAKAAQGNRDTELHDVATSCGGEIAAQLAWLTTQIGAASAQALLVAD